MLRLLFLLLLLYILLRLTRTFWTGLLKAFQSGLFPKGRVGGKPNQVIDEMRPCAHCGTYHPSQHSFRKKGLYFCNPQCHEAYQREKP